MNFPIERWPSSRARRRGYSILFCIWYYGKKTINKQYVRVSANIDTTEARQPKCVIILVAQGAISTLSKINTLATRVERPAICFEKQNLDLTATNAKEI